MNWIRKKTVPGDARLPWLTKKAIEENHREAISARSSAGMPRLYTHKKVENEEPVVSSILRSEMNKLESLVQKKVEAREREPIFHGDTSDKTSTKNNIAETLPQRPPRIIGLDDSPEEFFISPFSEEPTSADEDKTTMPPTSSPEQSGVNETLISTETHSFLTGFQADFPTETEKPEEIKKEPVENNIAQQEATPVEQESVEETRIPAEPAEPEEALSFSGLPNALPEEFTEEPETSWVDEALSAAEDSPEIPESQERASITPFVASASNYNIPISLIEKEKSGPAEDSPQEAQEVITRLETALDDFGIEGRVIGIQRGPIITRYEVKLAPGIKVSRVLGLTDEIAMALEALRVRIEAPIPGRSTIGIEVPNKTRKAVLLGDIVDTHEYKKFEGMLPLPLGKDIAGNVMVADLNKMPHLLIAGATGSGKSVAVNSFITSFIMNKTPEDIRFLLIDPKLVELSHYNDIPHLLHPVITDASKAVAALSWAVEEMERRYEDMADMRVRDIQSYNRKIRELNQNELRSQNPHPKMPFIVVLIDELGDLMMVAGKEVESSIVRLSQKARAVGIHLILATQRPSVDVITALIKANCPARMALQVAQKTDSRTILDSNGAEQLLGQGDMLFKHPSRGGLIRIQIPYVRDEEVEAVVKRVIKTGKPSYITLEDPNKNSADLEGEDEVLFEEAWSIIQESQKASASYLQRRLRIGYNRAARLIEAFEARGYIGPQIGSKPREILMN